MAGWLAGRPVPFSARLACFRPRSAGWGHHPLELAASVTCHHLIVIRLGPPHPSWLASSHPLSPPLLHLILPLLSQLHVALSAFPYTQADRHRSRSHKVHVSIRLASTSHSQSIFDTFATLANPNSTSPSKEPRTSKAFPLFATCAAPSHQQLRAPLGSRPASAAPIDLRRSRRADCTRILGRLSLQHPCAFDPLARHPPVTISAAASSSNAIAGFRATRTPFAQFRPNLPLLSTHSRCGPRIP